MAEENNEDEKPFQFQNYSKQKSRKSRVNSQSSEDEPPDLAIDSSSESKPDDIQPGERATNSSVLEMPRREENPFSFKHFLKRNSGTSYHNTGARPKVYSNQTRESYSTSDLCSASQDSGLYRTNSRHAGTPEISSVLPDFVQDHLVVEQSYLSHDDSHLAVNLDTLPELDVNMGRLNLDDQGQSDIPFDLTDSMTPLGGSRRSRNNTGSMPLDLPLADLNCRRLPFDLPLVGETQEDAAAASVQLGEVGISKSLPDFLSDGPIRGTISPDQTSSQSNGAHSIPQTPEQQLHFENERLRRELDITTRQLSDQIRRAQNLEKELCSLHTKDREEVASLEKAMEQVEDNLKRSTMRAITAENTVSKLKQEIKILTNNISCLRKENQELRFGSSQEPGASALSFNSNHEIVTQRLAQDLNNAAGSAENNLRQLLNGLNGLRVIASTLESLHKIHDTTYDYIPEDSDDQNGPIL